MKTLTQKITVILMIIFLSSMGAYAASTTCPGELITNLDGATDSKTGNDSGNITANTTYYYTFTPSVDGTLEVKSNLNKNKNSLFIQEGCSTILLKDETDSDDKTLVAFVTAGQEIVIALQRRSSNTANYSIAFSFQPGFITSTGRDFIERHQSNLFGDVKVLGNTVLCQLNAAGTACTESGNGVSNNAVNLQKAPESSSVLVLPTDAEVTYARLYWLGRIDGNWNSTTQTDAGQIDIKKDNGTYTTLTANVKDALKYSNNIYLYSASADASSIVDGSGTYYIDTSTFYTVTGKTGDGLGTSGSWALVVVYSDPNETTAKNVTIFDGYKGVQKNKPASASVSGFLTPTSNPVDSTVYVMAAEGDKYLSGTSDQVQMAGATFSTTLSNLGTMDSRIDVNATRTPKLINNNGTDIHKYNVGTTSGGSKIINPNETGANFNFTSNQDVYYPSLFVFSTQLYLPQMCYDYSIKQDGRYFSIDRAVYPEAQIDQQISSSDIEVGIYLRNEESDLAAEGIAIRTDLNTTLFNQTGVMYTSNINGSSLIDRGTPSYNGTLCDYDKNGDNSVTNNGCTDGHNIRKGNGSLGEFNYVYTKFSLEPQGINGIVDINTSLGLSIKYYVTANGSKIEYPDYVLGGLNVPICPPASAYEPEWGQFNVVSSGQTNNNLYTQVSRKPFSTDVIFDSDPATGTNDAPNSDIKTTVLVEMIDIDAYGDINASCGNPDASVSDLIFIPLDITPSKAQVNIPLQTPEYYNFATKNATFRVWYFADANQTLIQNWTASTDTSQRILSSISGLYDSSVHTACASSCSNTSSTTCFECIKINYAQSLCARDNFAVRPESFALNIYDIDPSLPAYDIDINPNNQKNITKVNTSKATGYAPGVLVPSDRMHLAAGYNYRFDINASGNDGIALVPGYTRSFNGGSDYNATLFWDPQSALSGCNDIDNRDIAFYFNNGKVENEERLHDNVGEYRLNLIDTTWTAVDWRDMSHHTISNGFDISSSDCVLNSDATSSAFNGCLIRSNHGSDAVGNIYRDHDLTFHPYKFGLTNTVTLRPSNSSPSVIFKPFVYMANIEDGEDMSVHLNTTVTAQGYDSNPLSNYVTGCYSKPLNVEIGKTPTSNSALRYNYAVHNIDIANAVISSHDQNKSIAAGLLDANATFSTTSSYFQKDQNGTIKLQTNLNYSRDVKATSNPEDITFTLLSVDDNATFFNGDLTNNKIADSNITIDQRVLHYYGRTNAPKITIECNSKPCVTGTHASSNSSTAEEIYYEIYCLGGACTSTILPIGTIQTNDTRWYTNTNHDKSGAALGTDGTIGTITEVSPSGHFNENNRVISIANYKTESIIQYNGPLPYDMTLQMQSSNWLIHNETDSNATQNEFIIRFVGSGGWSGKFEEDSTTKTISAPVTNRKIMW